jgi:hypothetical protein
MALVALLLIAGCANAHSGEMVVDFMFRKAGAPAGDVIELSTPALVNEIHGAFTIELTGYYPGAALDDDGKIVKGDDRVFLLEFTDHGDISLLRTDDKRVSLRAQLGPQGKVTRALLGSMSGAVVSGFTTEGNDTFESGTWEVLYDGPDVVVGRIDLRFTKYSVAGNFRAPRMH